MTRDRYFNYASSSYLATATVLVTSLLPVYTHPIPTAEPDIRDQYTNIGILGSNQASALLQSERSEILLNFASQLMENTEDMDYEIARITSDRFLDIYEDF